MSLVAAAILAIGGAGVVVVLRHRWTLAWAVGLAVLAAVAIAIVVGPAGAIPIGGTTLAWTPFTRDLLAAVALAALLLALVAASAAEPPTVVAALLAALVSVAAALIATDPTTAIWVLLGGGVAALATGLVGPPEADARRAGSVPPETAASTLRVLGGTGATAALGVALAVPSLASPAPDAGILGLAYVLVAVALGVRLAAVPAHRWAARLADLGPAVIVAPILGWLPVALALVLAGWQSGPLASTGVDLGPLPAVVGLVALVTVVLASVAALVREDVGHVIAYLVIADGGLVLLGLAIPDPTALGAVRAWVLLVSVSIAGLVGWLVSIESTFGTRRLPDLDGWARRSPALGLALALIAVATVGWPGSPALTARIDLAQDTLTGAAGLVLAAVSTAPLLAFARLLIAGLRRPGGAVASRPAAVLRLPAAWGVTDAGSTRRRLEAAARDVRAAWGLDRKLVGAGAVLAISMLSIAVAGGGPGRTALDSSAAGAPGSPGASASPTASAFASPAASTSASSGSSASPVSGASASP